ncbi:MAG: rod shape-determining protein MreC [Patescibacteria group bacterium]
MLKIKQKKIILYLAVIGLLIFLHFINVLKPVENFIVYLLNPLASGIYSVSSDIRITYNEQTDKRDLLKIVKELEEEINKLTRENAKLKNIEEENLILRQSLKFLTINEYKYVLANIISQTEFSQSPAKEKNIIIDKGREDGIIPGLSLVNSQGIIIGKVIETDKHISSVSLTTSSDCKLAATIQNNNRTIGVTEGELGLTIVMNFIPQTEVVNIGDTVVTSGLEKIIPAGLVIGKVIEVDQEGNEVWQKVVIEPLVDFNELVIVSVLLP